MSYHQGSRTLGHAVGRPRRRAQEWARVISAALITKVSVAILVALLCFLYVWQGTVLRDLTAQRASASAAWLEMEEINRTLEFQIEQAFSLERISRIARKRLGMIEPSVIRYVPFSLSEQD